MRGRIFLVPFPFDDLSANKVRPVLCLTDLIGPHRHVILAFISSRLPSPLLGSDVVIRSDAPDFQATGLRVASTVRLHRLMTATSGLLRRRLGMLSANRLAEVEQALKRLFGLNGTFTSSIAPSDS